MYSREQRMKAINLYIKYDKCIADVIHELDYPTSKSLTKWYEEYLEEQKTGIQWNHSSRMTKYSKEQKSAAVKYYLEHGRNLSRTVRKLEYPSREMLRYWLDELAPGIRKKRIGGIKYTQEQKNKCVVTLCTRVGSAKDTASEFGVTREALYQWKNSLLGKRDSITMPNKQDKLLPDDRDALLSEVELLKRQIRKLELEKDILEGTVEIVKKRPHPRHGDFTLDNLNISEDVKLPFMILT